MNYREKVEFTELLWLEIRIVECIIYINKGN